MYKTVLKKLEPYMDKNIQIIERKFILIEEINFYILDLIKHYLIIVITDYIYGTANGF